MSLRITCKNKQGIAFVTLAGRLRSGQDVLVFRLLFDGLVEQGHVHMAFNLSNLTELDASGVGALCYASRRLRKAGGRLAVFGLAQSPLPPGTDDKLHSLTVFETEHDAIDSFGASKQVRDYDVLELVRAMKREREQSQRCECASA